MKLVKPRLSLRDFANRTESLTRNASTYRRDGLSSYDVHTAEYRDELRQLMAAVVLHDAEENVEAVQVYLDSVPEPTLMVPYRRSRDNGYKTELGVTVQGEAGSAGPSLMTFATLGR